MGEILQELKRPLALLVSYLAWWQKKYWVACSRYCGNCPARQRSSCRSTSVRGYMPNTDLCDISGSVHIWDMLRHGICDLVWYVFSIAGPNSNSRSNSTNTNSSLVITGEYKNLDCLSSPPPQKPWPWDSWLTYNLILFKDM